MERGGDGEEEEQRQTVDERTDLLYCTTGHGRHPPQTGHARRYPQLQQQTHEKKVAVDAHIHHARLSVSGTLKHSRHITTRNCQKTTKREKSEKRYRSRQIQSNDYAYIITI